MAQLADQMVQLQMTLTLKWVDPYKNSMFTVSGESYKLLGCKTTCSLEDALRNGSGNLVYSMWRTQNFQTDFSSANGLFKFVSMIDVANCGRDDIYLREDPSDGS